MATAAPVTRRALIDDRHQGQPEVHDPYPPGEERGELPSGEEVVLRGELLAGHPVDTVRESVREPVHEREPGVHLDREPAVGSRDERAVPDPERLGDELPLTVAPTDVLDHRIREDDVELAVSERERAGVSLHVPDPGVASAEPGAVLEAERRDPSRPGVELLEEVERAAAVVLPEAELVGAHVEHRRLRRRLELLEEETELSPTRAERDGVDNAHGREVWARTRRARPGYAPRVVEATLSPRGPYSLRLTTGRPHWRGALQDGGWAEAAQQPDGRVFVRASSEHALTDARFLLALDDDTTEFHRRFVRDPMLGPSVQTLRGLRPRRKATVAHAVLRALCGQLIQAGRALEIERAVVRACAENPPSRGALAGLSPAVLVRCGLAASRAATLIRLCRTLDLEALRTSQRDTALARLRRERGIGEWTVGVIALQGLGRYDAGLVGDLGLVKLQASLEGHWPDPSETARLLEPYGEWQGLASVFLLRGFELGLIPGANKDRARDVRARTARAL